MACGRRNTSAGSRSRGFVRGYSHMTTPTGQPAVWREDTVTNWDKLVCTLHTCEMIPNQSNQGGHRRSPFVFRGMSNASWPLKTSLERLGSPPQKVEQPALRAFGRYAPVGTVSLK